jgi:hypothetical protein
MGETLDTQVRLNLYREFVQTGRAPSTKQIAAMMGKRVEEIRVAMERLATGKAIVLQPQSREVLMANPLCAVPTPYFVRAGERTYFGSCVWDALGVIAMLKTNATLETSCQDCGESMTIEIREGQPMAKEGVIHFALPAKRWWDDIVFN